MMIRPVLRLAGWCIAWGLLALALIGAASIGLFIAPIAVIFLITMTVIDALSKAPSFAPHAFVIGVGLVIGGVGVLHIAVKTIHIVCSECASDESSIWIWSTMVIVGGAMTLGGCRAFIRSVHDVRRFADDDAEVDDSHSRHTHEHAKRVR